jgi:hypothetical protein
MSERITRNKVVFVLGTPEQTEGSLNDPVEREEYGIRFNEKWIYENLRNDPAGVPMRTVYWHRYDFTGTTVRENAAAEWRHDTMLAAALKPAADRLPPIEDHHPALEGNRRYQPASEVRDARDLGGYIQEKTRRDLKDKS